MNIFKLSFYNIWRRRNKTILLSIITAVAICIFVSAISVYYTSSDAARMSADRLGADVVITPDSSEANSEEVLFTGAPKMMFMKEELLKNIPSDEIETMSNQFFIKTLGEYGCCTFQNTYRVVGVDFDTDFVVSPWLKKKNIKSLADNEMIIGSNVELEYKDEISLMGLDHKLKARLEKTGTNVDDTIFVSLKEARKLGKTFYDIENKDYFHGVSTDLLISSSLIKLKEGVNVKEFKTNLENKVHGIKVYSVDETSKELKDRLSGFNKIIGFFTLGILIITVISLFGMFNAMIEGRKKELGYLKSMGFKSDELSLEIVLEILYITVFGGFVGSCLGVAFAPKLMNILGKVMTVPSYSLDMGVLFKYGFLGVAMSLLISILVSIAPIVIVRNSDPRVIFSDGGIKND